MNIGTLGNPTKIFSVTTRIKDYEAIRILKAADVEDAEEKAISHATQNIQATTLQEAIEIATTIARESNQNKPIGLAGYREYKVVSVAEIATIDITYDQWLRTKTAVEARNMPNQDKDAGTVLAGPKKI